MKHEEWRAIKGYEGLYEVSSLGRIKSLRSGKMLMPKQLPNGYMRVKLPSRGGSRERYVHRLVADAFCNHPEGCDVVNHIDNDTTNNIAVNLEWATQRDNVMHAMNQGRVPNFPNAKAVIGTKDGKEYFFRSTYEAAAFAGCDPKTVWRGCRVGKVCQSGFLWKEANAG